MKGVQEEEIIKENKKDLPKACGKPEECGVIATEAKESFSQGGAICVKRCRETKEDED